MLLFACTFFTLQDYDVPCIQQEDDAGNYLGTGPWISADDDRRMAERLHEVEWGRIQDHYEEAKRRIHREADAEYQRILSQGYHDPTLTRDWTPHAALEIQRRGLDLWRRPRPSSTVLHVSTRTRGDRDLSHYSNLPDIGEFEEDQDDWDEILQSSVIIKKKVTKILRIAKHKKMSQQEKIERRKWLNRQSAKAKANYRKKGMLASLNWALRDSRRISS